MVENLVNIFQTSDQDSGNEEDGGDGGGEGKENGLFKNTNAASVHQAEREKRERAKVESQKKKEKDREDRYVARKLYVMNLESGLFQYKSETWNYTVNYNCDCFVFFVFI